LAVSGDAPGYGENAIGIREGISSKRNGAKAGLNGFEGLQPKVPK